MELWFGRIAAKNGVVCRLLFKGGWHFKMGVSMTQLFKNPSNMVKNVRSEKPTKRNSISITFFFFFSDSNSYLLSYLIKRKEFTD